jgi:hypothetical protein
MKKILPGLLLTLLIPLTSCGTIRTAVQNELKQQTPKLITAIVKGSTKWWNTDGKKFVVDLQSKTLAEAKSYADKKLEGMKDQIVTKLVAKGYKKENIDTNSDGKISQDEASNFLKSNPLALYSAGGLGVLYLLLNLAAKKVLAKKEDEEIKVQEDKK